MANQNDVKEESNSQDDDQMTSNSSSTTPLVTFALLTDVQYADVDNAPSFDKRMRYYRNSLNLVREAVGNWRKCSKTTGHPFKFILQLGDLIDGKCTKINDSTRSMNLLLDELNELFKDETSSATNDFTTPSTRVFNIWGNHEFYNFKRDELLKSPLNTARLLNQNLDSGGNYYSYQVTPKLRIICLDFFEYSILGFDESSPVYQNALEFLRKHNKNEDFNEADDTSSFGPNCTGINGSLSMKQVSWLKSELNTCKEAGSYAIVCGHLPIHDEAADVRFLAWNAKEMLECLWSFDKTVVAYFAGHDHQGGYFRDKKNIHHVTFRAIIETAPNSNAYATVNVYDDRVSIEGVGAISNYELFFRT